jgi:hypothetical protein
MVVASITKWRKELEGKFESKHIMESSNITNAKIVFTTDDGKNWTTIIGSTSASAGSYHWTIPNTPSTTCRIKFSDASDTTIKSISSSLFTIWIPTISLSSPNGGEIWKVGDIDSSKWTSRNITNAKIEFSTDNGTNWTTIVGSTPASVGYYPWIIPSTTSVNCLVRISNVSNININSISSNIFTISNPPCPGVAIVVYSGQTYNTVLIGSQCWSKENLNIGMRINGLQEQADNTIIEKYCYNNDSANCNLYGGLYQWAEAVQYQNNATNTTSPSPAFYGHVQGICPIGWHLPDTSEYSIILANIV